MPRPRPLSARLRALLTLPAFALLCGCDMVVLNPAGDVARQQGDLVIVSTLLMLLIIVPVMALVVLFAWRYRESNKEATYSPDWDHSTSLELVIWSAPLLIIICLGAITWVSTHLLDPYRPLSRTGPNQPVAANVKPLEVQVVALDWKWLFIYPEQGIATVNEMAAPVGRPIRFRISASSVMNSFYIPALAGQIYAMPAMETPMNAVFDKTGVFQGLSANYSGHGFSKMRFKAHSLDQAGFDAWVAEAKKAGGNLDRAGYLQLERPSEGEPVRRFAGVEAGLFDRVVNMCVQQGKMCMHQMMMLDAQGGTGKAGLHNVHHSEDKTSATGTHMHGGKSFVGELCADQQDVAVGAKPQTARPVKQATLTGAGLKQPSAKPTPIAPSVASETRPRPFS
ncbi:cytochrome o ubiquinol oxidase subunit 2 [Sphingomonas kyeonggiensis]|uniref:ubiquinol oxidase subunit II n=1 Tax=Sphingomonas kyeonggiensis TaxID=1268553 RepID=UPI00277FAA8D|nr:ubiquinol oxidase subunit II [Sphingomonas kyeonggiensis]MDQ0252001.1 cytochrome o ubiquinol oxidase subunit 2 [Sphingomonas kyeonggiensis]